jgi:hypothetical protein
MAKRKTVALAGLDCRLPSLRVDEIEPAIIWTRIRSGNWAGALLAWQEPNGIWVRGIVEFNTGVERLTALEKRIKKADFHQNLDDPLVLDPRSLEVLLKEQRSAKMITVTV